MAQIGSTCGMATPKATSASGLVRSQLEELEQRSIEVQNLLGTLCDRLTPIMGASLEGTKRQSEPQIPMSNCFYADHMAAVNHQLSEDADTLRFLLDHLEI